MRKALLLIDIINDFFHPKGQNYYVGYEDIRNHITQLLERSHEAGALVVHAIESHRPGPDYEFLKLPIHCLEASWDTEVPDWLPAQPDDITLKKRRYSAFFATDLDLLLRERSITDLIVAGVKTHVCIRATIQDAFACGYRVHLVREATGSNRTHLHTASMEDIERYFGRVIPIAEATAMLQKEPS